ncbi:HTTM domain-containing protein [Brevibacterium atlanticum]|uniref:HTTM domain-containing protein n=1 Tax=Brevibacterium atlanticum TaxID=2697563 RepID=UPI001D1880CD|nr:HTTM domain-containing protein [Brevibacterium atlanticum]
MHDTTAEAVARPRAVVKISSGEEVTGWMRATDVELDHSTDKPFPPRSAGLGIGVASDLKGSWDDQPEDQKAIVKLDSFRGGDSVDRLTTKLREYEDPDGAVGGYLDSEHVATAYATQVARAVWGDDVRTASAKIDSANMEIVPLSTQARTAVARGWDRLEVLLTGRYHATYGLAVTRILIGLTGLGLILTNFNARHYAFGVGNAWSGEIADPKSDFPDIWLFSLFHRAVTVPPLFTAMMIGLAILAIVITLGWRTRIVLPFYLVLWVSFIELNDGAGDQGDNAYRMFLIALLFADTTRRWSLDARRRARRSRRVLSVDGVAGDAFGTDPDAHGTAVGSQRRWVLIMANNLAIVVLAFQVCAIYMSGGLYKAGGAAWQHGFAVYNPLQTQQFGTWPVLSDLVTAWGPMVVVISWASVLFQCAFPFMLFNRWTRIAGLLGILSFHLGIALLMGLPWFSLTMIAVDAIFIRDNSFANLDARLQSWWHSDSPGSRHSVRAADLPTGNEHSTKSGVF